jgi:hypothetical protein
VTLDLSSGSGETWYVQWQRASDGLYSDTETIVGGNGASLANPFGAVPAFVHVTQDVSTLFSATIFADGFESGDTTAWSKP